MSATPVLSYSPENQLLLCAAHPHLSPERRERLTSLLATPLDWDVLLSQLKSHGIGPMLFSHLKKMPDVAFPETARDKLKCQANSCMADNMVFQHMQIRLLAAFKQAGIEVMPLKGLYLAHLLYGGLSLRKARDIDLLVRQEDLEKATQVLLDLSASRKWALEQEADLYHHSFFIPVNKKRQVHVELHWALTFEHIAGLDVDEVWRAASQTVWKGQAMWTMALSDLLLYLCLHAAKDGLGSVRHLVDIALLLEQCGPQLDWEALAEKIRALQIKTPIFLSLTYCKELLDAPVPSAFLAAIRPPRGISWALGQALLRWRGGVLHTPPALIGPPLRQVFFFFWEDSLQGKLRHLHRALMPPRSLRTRWLSRPALAPFGLWYPFWVWRVVQKLVKLFIARAGDGY